VFTQGQVQRMIATINIAHESKKGTFDQCQSSPVVGIFNHGSFENIEATFDDLILNVKNDLVLNNSKLTFNNCVLKFDDDVKVIMGLGANPNIAQSELILNNSKFISDTDGDCGQGEFFGIEVNTRGRIKLTDGSVIEAQTPISGSGLNGNFEHVTVIGDDFTLTGSSGTAIHSEGSTLILGRDAIINGGILLNDDQIHAGYHPSSRVVFSNSKINDFGGLVNPVGMSLFDAWCGLNNETEVNGFPFALRSTEGYLRINKSYIEGTGGPGVVVSNPLLFELNNSHFEQCRLDLSTAVSYNIKNNKFNGCGNFGLCSFTAIVGGDDVIHFFENNIINAPRSGVRSDSKVQTKFLCNDFDESPVQNFNWLGVNALQGKSQFAASGNKFSEMADQIGGMSPSVTYNYNSNNLEEILDNYSNTGNIIPNVTLEAGCGLIGPDWISPVGNIADDPDDPDVKNDCPLGIDCTQDCPVGIDCTNDCPIGIDCTSPCPPGIDCTQDCPPGIDCTVPCPPGVDCNEPCPNGKDCDPIGDPVLDPVIHIVETEYVDLENEKEAIQAAYYNNDDVELKRLVESQSIGTKEELLKYVSNNSYKLDSKWLLDIMDNSEYYTESEMLEIITANHLNIYDEDVNELIYHSNSFSSTNIDIIRDVQSNFSMSSEVGDLWTISQIEYRQMQLIQYALLRLRHYEWKSYDQQSVWYNRVGTLHSALTNAENYFDIEEYSILDQIFSSIQSSEDFTLTEKQDAIQYRLLLDMLSDAGNNGEKLSTLSEDRINQLANWAYSGFYHTSVKAKGILETFYNYEFDETQSSYVSPDPMQFLSLSTSVLEQEAAEFSLYPNPNNGNFEVMYSGDKEANLVIFDITGRQVYQIKNVIASKEYQVTELESGVYIYQLSDSIGNVIETDKVNVIRD